MAKPRNYSESSSDKESLQRIMFPAGKTYPLNSKRIVASQLQTLVGFLDLLKGASTLEMHKLIEGRLPELNYQLQNVQIVVQEDEGRNTNRILLVDESRIIRQSEIKEICHPSPPVSISCHDTIINNTVCQQHTFSPVNNGDGDALELCSALCKTHRDNERSSKTLSEQSLLLQRVTKQLEDTKLMT